MRGGRNGIKLSVSALALALSQHARAQDTVAVQPARKEVAEAQPAERSLSFTVPLVTPERALGDVTIEVRGQEWVSVERVGITRELDPLLNDEGRAALQAATGDREMVDPELLRQAGFELEFDSGQLQLVINSIRPDLRVLRSLGADRGVRDKLQLRTIAPASFSSYLNITTNYDYDTRSGSGSPDFFFDGATRIQGFVIEYEGALTDQFDPSYSFARRSTRVVYDDPNSFRRYTAGDLRLTGLSVLRNPQIGGIAVEKRRQIFDPTLSVTRLSGRQIFLDNRSTVDVLINGQRFDTFQLDAGTYDLSNLPIQQGANDIQLLVRDSFGQQQIIDYNFFFEALPLPEGEEEYSLAIGVLSDTFGFQPDYTNELAATGFYRKALSQNLILGGAFQLSEDVQVLGGTISAVPQFLPGVFDLEVAASHSNVGEGLAIRAGYRLQTGDGLDGSSQFAVNVDYESGGFATIDNILPLGFDLLSVSASYSRSFGTDTFVTVGGNYLSSGGATSEDYNVFAEVNYRLNERMRLTAGVEYGSKRDFREAFGVRVGITMALGGRARATADYRSRLDNLRASISRGSTNDIGSFGFDVGFSKFGDSTQGDLQLDYVSNRFNARADVSTSGNSFGGLFDDQRVRVQVGTSIAVADGTFGIGRPINDSFLLAASHPALEGQGVVTARTIARGNYYARSGALGAAVQGDLSPYNEQNIQFDAADPVDGFDVGDGTVLVDPPYKSGYRVTVGSAYFKSVIGVLTDEKGPVALASGRVESADGDEEFASLPFFTNRAGRFGIFGLAPGRSYVVRLNGSERTLRIDVPAEGDAVVRMGTVPTEPSEPETISYSEPVGSAYFRSVIDILVGDGRPVAVASAQSVPAPIDEKFVGPKLFANRDARRKM